MAEKRGFGEGRFGEGPYGGTSSGVTNWIVRLGQVFRLLPPDRALTLTDRKRNAALAIAGITTGALALLAELLISLGGGY